MREVILQVDGEGRSRILQENPGGGGEMFEVGEHPEEYYAAAERLLRARIGGWIPPDLIASFAVHVLMVAPPGWRMAGEELDRWVWERLPGRLSPSPRRRSCSSGRPWRWQDGRFRAREMETHGTAQAENLGVDSIRERDIMAQF